MRRIWIIALIAATLVVAVLAYWAIDHSNELASEEVMAARLGVARGVVAHELEHTGLGGARAGGQLREAFELLRELELDLETLAGPEPQRSRARRAWREARTQLADRASLRGLGSWTITAIRSGATWPALSKDEAELVAVPKGGLPSDGLRYYARTKTGTIARVSWTFLPRELADASDWALVEWLALDSDAGRAHIESIERKLGWKPGTLEIDLVEPGSPQQSLPELEDAGEIQGLEYNTLARLRVPPDLYRPAWPSTISPWPIALASAYALWLLSSLYLGVRGRRLDKLSRRIERSAEAGHIVEPLGEGSGPIAELGRSVERAFATLSQEQIFRADAERRAAWEEVARRVAHEVKNPLTPIRLAIDNLQRASARGDDALSAALPVESAAIREEVRRLERLVNEFHEFARLPVPTFAALELVPLLREALEGQTRSHDAVALEVDVVEEPPILHADPDLLVMAFTNLARNAVQAMGEGGGTLRARIDVIERGCRLLVEIEDEGPGLSQEQLETIFEPYVTGREDGTGLGLAITRRIIAGHGGTIEAAAGAGGGALFRVFLPVRGRSFTSQA
jgi:signal transduction histidine kinase